MAWFLWEGDYGATIQNFKKRLEYKVEAKEHLEESLNALD